MEKTKHSLKPIKPQSFTILWASIQAFAWGLIFVLLMNLPLNTNNWQELVIYAFVGIMVGSLSGALQMALVERASGRHLRHWVLLTTGASMLGFVSIQILMTSNFFYYDLSPYIALAPLFVLPALAQWWSLREHTRSGWLWIAAHIIADMVFIMMLLSSQEANILLVIIPAALQGILTGFVMFWLLERLPKPLSDNLTKMRYHEVMES